MYALNNRIFRSINMKQFLIKACLLTSIILNFETSAQTVATVGQSVSTTQCDFLTIQAAINSGATEVRVLNNQTFFENLIIDDSIDLKGGYTNCLQASLDQPSGGNTAIDASQLLGSPAVFISSTQNPSIRLYRLRLENAIDTSIVDGGRGLHVGDSNGLIELFDVSILNNAAENGAGIYASNPPGSLRIILNNSAVFGNTATNRGGGIFCGNNNTFITIQNNSGVFENQASNGGGVAAVNGCSVTVSSGSDARLGETFAGIVNNLATNNGGGIFADLAAEIFLQGNRYGLGGLLGNSVNPATLSGNQALNDGGGIAAYRGSQVEVYDGLIWNNKADNYGGGFYLEDSSSLSLTKSSYSSCWDQSNCSFIANNTASRGGVLYQKQNAQTSIKNSYITNNNADFGLVIYSAEDGVEGGFTALHDNVIYENGSNSNSFDEQFLIRGIQDVSIEIIHNTITENTINNISGILGAALGAVFDVKNSIIHNTGETVYSGSEVDLTADCVLVNEALSISGTNIRNQPPGFVNPFNNDFHLGLDSEAIDMCAGINGFTTDIEGEARGFDDPVFDLAGTFDAGADETYVSDIIFRNSFE